MHAPEIRSQSPVICQLRVLLRGVCVVCVFCFVMCVGFTCCMSPASPFPVVIHVQRPTSVVEVAAWCVCVAVVLADER